MDMLRMIEEGNYQGELIMPPDVLDYWVETFEATGFTGGLSYYRANMGGGGAAAPGGDIDVPCLYVGAENDTILRPSSSDRMPAFIPDLERHVIADCGHWTQQEKEKPDEFDRVTLDWIDRVSSGTRDGGARAGRCRFTPSRRAGRRTRGVRQSRCPSAAHRGRRRGLQPAVRRRRGAGRGRPGCG